MILKMLIQISLSLNLKLKHKSTQRNLLFHLQCSDFFSQIARIQKHWLNLQRNNLLSPSSQ